MVVTYRLAMSLNSARSDGRSMATSAVVPSMLTLTARVAGLGSGVMLAGTVTRGGATGAARVSQQTWFLL